VTSPKSICVRGNYTSDLLEEFESTVKLKIMQCVVLENIPTFTKDGCLVCPTLHPGISRLAIETPLPWKLEFPVTIPGVGMDIFWTSKHLRCSLTKT